MEERKIGKEILRQIESSPENRFARVQEIKSLMNKKTSAITDVPEILHDDRGISMKYYLNQPDGLAWSWSSSYDRGADESIKSLGLGKILNDSLRTAIKS